MTNIMILGAAGRMGKALIRCAESFEKITVTAAVDRTGHPDTGKDVGTVAGTQPIEVNISDDINEVSADVQIDFSFHESAPGNALAAREKNRAIVIGTTGLTEEETAALHDAATVIPVLLAPNMSLGVNLLLKLVQDAASALGLDYDAEVVEMHHNRKQDSPSGTALKIAEHIAAGRNQVLNDVVCYGRSGQVGPRPQGEIGIHGIRGGDIVGDHRVILASEGESIELAHRATNRDTFAMGALRAALWIKGREPGLYSMQDMLGL